MLLTILLIGLVAIGLPASVYFTLQVVYFMGSIVEETSLDNEPGNYQPHSIAETVALEFLIHKGHLKVRRKTNDSYVIVSHKWKEYK